MTIIEKNIIFSLILFSFFLISELAQSQDITNRMEKQNKFSLNGYFQDMPAIDFTKGIEAFNFNNTLHNRINMNYSANENFSFVFEIRNRFVSGDMIKNFSPIIVDMLKEDNGLINASFVPYYGDNWLWHVASDRFFIDWKKDKLQIRVGRQRINWGINMVSNPNDLFNTYSFFDIDYPERPGADALRLQYFTGELSRIDFAFSPDKDIENSTAALMYAFNKNAYDFQLIGGYYRNRLAIGGGWAGSIGASGFKGEVSLFNDFDKFNSDADLDLIASVSFDYIFPNTIYVLVEGLYNGGHNKLGQNIFMMTEPMRADNIFISKYAITTSVMYPLSPVFSTSLAGSYMPDLNAFYVSPNLTYSVITNIDASILAQYFFFDDNDFSLEMLAIFMQVKWSF